MCCFSFLCIAHDIKGLCAGRCYPFYCKALHSKGTSPKRSAGICGSRAEYPLPKAGLQHSESHWTAYEAWWARGKCRVTELNKWS